MVLVLHGEVVHQLQHEVFQNHAQAARANFAVHGQLGDGFERVVGEAQAHIFEFEEALILLEKSIFRLGQNFNQRGFVEIVHYACNGQAADKFGDQSVADQIAGLDMLEQFGIAALGTDVDESV